MRSPYAAAVADYDQNFTTYWNTVFSQYNAPDAGDRVWMAGPSAYVFSLAGEKFAVDLQIRREKDFNAVLPQLLSDTAALSFILITHQHDDHMCLPLMNALKDTAIRWYIPDGCREELIEASGLKKENIIRVRPGDRWQIGALQFRAFYSPHVKADDPEVFAQCGYEITAPAGKILLPADVRDYAYCDYPDFGRVDLCFSHLWAGNDALEPQNYLPLLDEFACFNSKFRARTYFFCHLYEIGRSEQYLRHNAHAALAADRLLSLLPESTVEVPRLGRSYSLDFSSMKEGHA